LVVTGFVCQNHKQVLSRHQASTISRDILLAVTVGGLIAGSCLLVISTQS